MGQILRACVPPWASAQVTVLKELRTAIRQKCVEGGGGGTEVHEENNSRNGSYNAGGWHMCWGCEQVVLLKIGNSGGEKM